MDPSRPSATSDAQAAWEGCWVCLRLQEDEFRSVRDLLGRLAGDGEALALVAEAGLCAHHMWYLSRMASEGLVRQLVAAFLRAAAARGPATDGCPVCGVLEERQQSYLRDAASHVRSTSPSCLCLPHVRALSGVLDAARWADLWTHYRAWIQEIADLLSSRGGLGSRPLSAGRAVALSHGRRRGP